MVQRYKKYLTCANYLAIKCSKNHFFFFCKQINISKIFRCLFSVLHHALYIRSSIHLSSTPSAPTYVQLKARFIGPVLTKPISANSFHDIRQHTHCTFNLFLHFSLFSLLCINLSFLHIVESNKSSLYLNR